MLPCSEKNSTAISKKISKQPKTSPGNVSQNILVLKNRKLFSPKKTDFNFLYKQNGNDNKENNTFTQNDTDTAGRVSKY